MTGDKDRPASSEWTDSALPITDISGYSMRNFVQLGLLVYITCVQLRTAAKFAIDESEQCEQCEQSGKHDALLDVALLDSLGDTVSCAFHHPQPDG